MTLFGTDRDDEAFVEIVVRPLLASHGIDESRDLEYVDRLAGGEETDDILASMKFGDFIERHILGMPLDDSQLALIGKFFGPKAAVMAFHAQQDPMLADAVDRIVWAATELDEWQRNHNPKSRRIHEAYRRRRQARRRRNRKGNR